MAAPATRLICFDCDSTLSAVEGIDELARGRGPDVFRQVEQMTRDAMEGRLALDDIFRLRLELIRPTQAEVAALAELYQREVEPTAADTIARLRARGWMPVIVSGGYTQAIEPLAQALGITRIEAVRLQFGPDGRYRGFDDTHPAARNGGKPELVRRLRQEFDARLAVMVGDGMSDAETVGAVDVFVGFGRYARRERVEQASRHFILSLSELLNLLE